MNKIKKIINNLITPGETLSQKVVKGGFWVFFLRIVNRGFSLVRLIILARILSPDDFGLMGIALLTMSTLETFSQTGFQAALIQKKEDIRSYLNSAWTVLILRGTILFVILYFIAPYAAIFFNTPEAKPIIRVIGFAILFKAFTNIGVTYFQKELEFNKEFIYQFSGTLADFIVAISAVLILRNVWALVLGLLAGNIVRCFVSYFIHPYKPHLSSDLKKIKELFGFGKWIFGSSILIFLITQGDDIFVGRMLGTASLGLYQLAYKISNLVAIDFGHVLNKVMFPAFSKLQSSNKKFNENLIKALRLGVFFSFPITGGIIAIKYDLVNHILGEKWESIVPLISLLVLQACCRSIRGILGVAIKSKGHPEIVTKVSIVQLIFLAFFIYPSVIFFGLNGVATIVVLQSLITIPLLLRSIIILTKLDYSDFLNILIQPFFVTIVMVSGLFIVRIEPMSISSSVFIIFVKIVIGIFIYFISNLLCFKMGVNKDLYNDLKKILNILKIKRG